MIKVSVIVPIYNVKNYIDRQIKSILAQTMSEWELILVDDGSTDGVKEMLEMYVKTDSRIRAIYHENNQGVAGARRTGWMHAKGEYICFFDADDWLEPVTLDELYKKATQNNADIICFSYVEEYVAKSKRFHFRERKDVVYNAKDAIKELNGRRNLQPHAWNKLYKRSLFEDRMFSKIKCLGEDYGMLMDLFEKCEKIVQTDEAYYHYTLRKGSSLDMGFSDFYRNGFYFYKDYEIKLIEKYKDLRKDILCYHLVEQMAIVVSMFKNDVYNHEIRKQVTKHVRRNLWTLLFANGPAFKFKIAAVAMSIHYKILKHGYLLVYSKQRKARVDLVQGNVGKQKL